MSGKNIKAKRPTEAVVDKVIAETNAETNPEPTAAEKLKLLEEEKKKLKEQLALEKKNKKAEKAEKKAERNAQVERTDGKLEAIQQKIYAYNKLGKAARSESDILNEIRRIAEEVSGPEKVEE